MSQGRTCIVCEEFCGVSLNEAKNGTRAVNIVTCLTFAGLQPPEGFSHAICMWLVFFSPFSLFASNVSLSCIIDLSACNLFGHSVRYSSTRNTSELENVCLLILTSSSLKKNINNSFINKSFIKVLDIKQGHFLYGAIRTWS